VKLNQRAEKEGTTVSDVVRSILVGVVDRNLRGRE
jgi:hypothetical protein